MDKSEFYLNQRTNHECFKLPGKDAKYLLKENFLKEFFSDSEKAEARFNLGITPLLNELKALIYAKLVDDAGNLKFGQEPTNGEENIEAYSEVLSSAVIYNTLLKYYTKEEINGWIDNLEERLSTLGIVDDNLDEDSEYPVQNKIITRALRELHDSYNRLANNKADKEELLNYNTIDEISDLLSQLEESLTQSWNEQISDVAGRIDSIEEFLGKVTVTEELDKSIVEYILELEQKVDAIIPLQSQDIQNVVNSHLLFYGEN